MASTNKTTNYELSQFLGSDKPAWLSDYNSDMNKIDTQMKANADAATAAGSNASSALTEIGDLTQLTTTAKTSAVAAINEVDSNADTAQNTANSAYNKAGANEDAIAALSSYLDLNTFTTPTVSITGATLNTQSTNISCASNSDGSLGKIYGDLRFVAQSSTAVVTFPTPLRPNTALTVNGIVVGQYDGTNIIMRSMTIGTDGLATITFADLGIGAQWRCCLTACLIFAKSFGDTQIDS